MAIIVLHKKQKERFLLLGTGYGAHKAIHTGGFMGHLMPEEDSGTHEMVAVCDKNGDIKWYPSKELKVINVDDKKLEEYNL